ncbi:MAG: V-type ATP synthase subunit I, partial [Methanobrevibacter sp.]|nr:V-type ATP synthase subunit I [Methanobrevibacter sp.]
MFQTERMRKLRILTLNQYSSSIVRDLHEEGIVQIEDISERIQQNPEWADSIKPSKMTPLIGRISSLLMKTTGISETFGNALAEDTGIKDMILSFVKPVIPVKREVDSLDSESLINKAESLLDVVESQTKVIEEKLSAIDSEKSLVTLNESLAQKLINFDLDLSLLKDTGYTTHTVGRINVESASKLKEELNNVTDSLLFFEDKKVSKEKDKLDSKVVIITALNEFKEEVLSVIRGFEFEKLEIGDVEGTPSQIISNSKNRLKELENEKSQVTNQLKKVAEKYDEDILVLKEQLEIEKERNEVFATFGETDKTKLLEAWVPSKEYDNVTNLIDKSSEGHFIAEFEDVGKDDSDAPVLHNNPSIVKPYEFLVGMYAPIRYGEIDPTFLVFLMFPFFFGFCLTEAAYGALFAIIGVVLYKGIGKVNKTMKDFGAILVASGLWAIVLGLLTGGFMGDFFPR